MGAAANEGITYLIGPPVFDDAVLTLYIAKFAQRLTKGRNAEGSFHRYAMKDAARLLCDCDAAAGNRCADETEEISVRHSITSSARASNVAGPVTPSALAVLRLMARLNPIPLAANPCCNRGVVSVGPKPWEGNATTRFHQSRCWFSHDMAARFARAAAGNDARWYRDNQFSDVAALCRIQSTPTGAWIC